MTNKKIEEYNQRLVEVNKMENFEERKRQLKELARQVGAGQAKYFVKGNEDSLSELTDNIHYALQTASMIDMCRTAAKNYEIASRATKIAFGSALAAWAAVLAMVLIAAFTR